MVSKVIPSTSAIAKRDRRVVLTRKLKYMGHGFGNPQKLGEILELIKLI